ncbi:hypothetical protein [Flavobacterium selenitireducens]|uniref:hypothetical protein n=1 Tax=Flavobacterium selenitireducens TaxID=2722704 RepID=UPI00168A6E88|nr:hypothetical protein [Flavobacterium selenitireducens]MBD3583907.1 hypothetical protein [Flavobacterium selenitireducens]
MIRVIISLLICLISTVCVAQNCSLLKDGKYEMFYDSAEENVSAFEIKDNKYFSVEDNNEEGYIINELDKCCFQILKPELKNDSNLTEFQKIINRQKRYFEITGVEGNVFYFICRVNLHVNCGTGKFVKKS